MFLYSLTLQRPTAITHAVHGSFAGTKKQLIAVARGKYIELLRAEDTGKVSCLLSHEIFGVVRSISAFRLTGGTKDFLVVGTDSGKITILEYLPEKNVFGKVHQETFGKSGCRRIVPGQHLAADPKGRAVMIGALEKQKLVYILNRDAEARLTISSPLDAHKLDYEDIDEDPTGEALSFLQMTLTFYELDLGLNHVVRKESTPLDEMANKLIPVPGGTDGPGGILVCSEDHVTWRTTGDYTPVTVNIPRRQDGLRDIARKSIINCYTLHKTKRMFFFLLQTEEGDIFKLTMHTDEDEVVGLVLKYFDTVPVAADMCLLKSGMLFVASEFGDHHLYQIAQLGDNADEPDFTSLTPPEETLYFTPRELRNLVLLDEQESLAPILGCEIADLANEDTPQFFALCGRGPRSSVRTLRHGLQVTEMAVSKLPGSPTAIWTVRRHVDEAYDSYIVVSFVNATLVLSIGDTVEEVTDSGFLATSPTLSASRIGDDALIQIYPEGIRHIRADGRVNEWKTPGKRAITHCAVNERQVAIALAGGELAYFELDPSGQLNEYTERMELSSEVLCMALGPVPEGQLRSRFLAVGLSDNTIRMVSLHQGDCLQPLSMQALPGPAESLCLLEMGAEGEGMGSLFLNIGLENGVLLKTSVDTVTGDLSDTRTRYLGARGIRLHQVNVQGRPGLLALSTRPWLSYMYQGQSRLTPLSCDALDYASPFTSEQCPEGVVAIARQTLRILALERLGTVFNQSVTPLQYTPRKAVLDEEVGIMALIEGDHHALSESGKAAVVAKAEAAAQAQAQAEPPAGSGAAMDTTADGGAEGTSMDTSDDKPAGDAEPTVAAMGPTARLDEPTFGEPKAPAGCWAANVRLVDPLKSETLALVPLEENEMALSIGMVRFSAAADGAAYLVVGTVTGLELRTRNYAEAALCTYRMSRGEDGGAGLTLVHRTVVDELPMVLRPFQGRLVAGVGKALRIYDLGKRKLLRKCENKHLPNNIVDIQTMGHRMVVMDQKDSFFFVKYRPSDNILVVFCDDTNPRWCTVGHMLDYSTIVGADKFGNVTVARVPADATDELEDDPTGSKAFWDRGLLNGASQKLEIMAQFYVGETILSLQTATLSPGGSECVVYTTLSGTIGALLPFSNKEDVDFFQNLEMHLRQENPPLCGRDHLAYRSYYAPVKNVIDGDLCEQFNAIDVGKRRDIAEELDRSAAEVSKKLEDLRNRYTF